MSLTRDKKGQFLCCENRKQSFRGKSETPFLRCLKPMTDNLFSDFVVFRGSYVLMCTQTFHVP